MITTVAPRTAQENTPSSVMRPRLSLMSSKVVKRIALRYDLQSQSFVAITDALLVLVLLCHRVLDHLGKVRMPAGILGELGMEGRAECRSLSHGTNDVPCVRSIGGSGKLNRFRVCFDTRLDDLFVCESFCPF